MTLIPHKGRDLNRKFQNSIALFETKSRAPGHSRPLRHIRGGCPEIASAEPSPVVRSPGSG